MSLSTQVNHIIFDFKCHGFAENETHHLQTLKQAFFDSKNSNSLPSRFKSNTKVLASIRFWSMRIRQKSELLPMVFLSKLHLNIGTL